MAALATVADVVPLVGENRVIVKHGLRVLSASRWPGIRALIEVAGLGGRVVDAPVDTPFGRMGRFADPTGAPFQLVA